MTIQELKNELGNELEEIIRRPGSVGDEPNKYNWGARRKNNSFISLGHIIEEALEGLLVEIKKDVKNK